MEDQLTAAGNVVGTVSHMSPEQIRGERLDARTDLFSFGIVLYEMATGKLPFEGNTQGSVFDSILNRAPIPPVQLNAPCLPSLRASSECLEKDRELRYQHASEIRADLQRLKQDLDSAQVASALAQNGNVKTMGHGAARRYSCWPGSGVGRVPLLPTAPPSLPIRMRLSSPTSATRPAIRISTRPYGRDWRWNWLNRLS